MHRMHGLAKPHPKIEPEGGELVLVCFIDSLQFPGSWKSAMIGSFLEARSQETT